MIILKKMWKNMNKNHKEVRTINEVEYSNINLNDYIVIDVRTRREFSETHLNGAINIPLLDIKKSINKYVKDKSKKILIYCQSGIRSKQAVNILNTMGYTMVYNLKGGIENI